MCILPQDLKVFKVGDFVRGRVGMRPYVQLGKMYIVSELHLHDPTGQLYISVIDVLTLSSSLLDRNHPNWYELIEENA